MDGPESEWEIKESSTDGKLSWVLSLGRKILVTGIVLSSAPLVLPPIMAISAAGLVCSIPYGVLLISYACTKTLMSRLLPMPSAAPPLLLEYGKPFEGEDESNKDIIEFVEKGSDGLDKRDILEKDANIENGVENDGKESIEQVDETGYEEDDRNERPSESFEEVKEMTGLNVEQPIIEESRNEQPAGIEAVVEGVNKCGSNSQKETPLESENVEEEKELVGETRQSVEKKDARRKRRKKPKSKSEGTTKVKGEHSINGSVNEQPGDKEKTSEMKNVAASVENDELVRNSKGSLERSRKEGTSLDAAEDRQGGEQEQVDVKFKISNGDEGTTRGKQEPITEESSAKQRVDGKSIGPLGGLDGSEEEDKEIPLDGKNVLVQLIQGIDAEENEKLTREQLKEMEILGTVEVNEEEYVRDGSMSEQPIEKICNIVVEFEGDEESGRNMKYEASLQKKKVDFHLTQSTDIVEDEELVRETRGLLEKIRDEGKKSEEIDVEKRAQSIGSVSKTVHDNSITKGPTVESVTLRGEQAEYVNEDTLEPNYGMNKEKKVVVLSDVNEREINVELGADLLEIASTVSLLGSPPEENTEESQPSSSYSVHQEASDSSDLPVSTQYEGTDDIRISAENAIDTASNEAVQSEEKIWEQMNALRTIVGYEAAQKETCIEELKALYLFTGIEPPESLKDTCDLDEVDVKLGFLKSVVGVK